MPEANESLLEAMSAAVKGDTRRARVILKRILRRDPKNLEALIAIGALLNTSEETAEDAMKYLIRAVKIDPKNPTAWSHLAESLLLLERYERAEKYFRKAIELKPDNPNYWHRLGIALDKLKRREEAIYAISKSLELNPMQDSPWISLGLVYLRQKNTEKAIESFQKALVLNPQNSLALKQLEEAKDSQS
ncbi:MAG: tetratricopeptide repeat protein [Candidatus Thorarchaeota archaeon]